jgi:hypothetical protein
MSSGASREFESDQRIQQLRPLADKSTGSRDVFRSASGASHPAEGWSVVAGCGKAGSQGFEQRDRHHFVEGGQGKDVGGLVKGCEAVTVD